MASSKVSLLEAITKYKWSATEITKRPMGTNIWANKQTTWEQLDIGCFVVFIMNQNASAINYLPERDKEFARRNKYYLSIR
jgi:hypothetical protein